MPILGFHMPSVRVPRQAIGAQTALRVQSHKYLPNPSSYLSIPLPSTLHLSYLNNPKMSTNKSPIKNGLGSTSPTSSRSGSITHVVDHNAPNVTDEPGPALHRERSLDRGVIKVQPLKKEEMQVSGMRVSVT